MSNNNKIGQKNNIPDLGRTRDKYGIYLGGG